MVGDPKAWKYEVHTDMHFWLSFGGLHIYIYVYIYIHILHITLPMEANITSENCFIPFSDTESFKPKGVLVRKPHAPKPKALNPNS